MLPNLRFIAASVVATVALMMFGFGLFAAFRLANQSSVVLARTNDVLTPPVFAQEPEAEPSAAPPPRPDADPPARTAEVPAASVPDPPAPPKEAEAPRAEEARLASAPVPPADAAERTGVQSGSQAAAAAAPEPAETARAPSDAGPAAMPEPAEEARAQSPSAPPVVASPPARPLASPVASPLAPVSETPTADVPPPVETTGAVKPNITAREAASPPRSGAPPKIKKKIARPAVVRKPQVRRVVRRVAPKPAQPIDSFSTWNPGSSQPSRQPSWQQNRF